MKYCISYCWFTLQNNRT